MYRITCGSAAAGSSLDPLRVLATESVMYVIISHYHVAREAIHFRPAGVACLGRGNQRSTRRRRGPPAFSEDADNAGARGSRHREDASA